MSSKTLYEFYSSLFEGVLANSDDLKSKCFQLRHQIYCCEIMTEPQNSMGLERDQYDDFSFHALLRYRPSQLDIGTVRLVLPQAGKGISPVFQLLRENGLVLPPFYTPDTTAEISRFAISKLFRRRVIDTVHSSSYTASDLKADRHRIIPCMALGLMMMIYKMTRHHEIKQWCAVMEPSLLRLLGRLGIHFHAIGPLIAYHGQRQLCCAVVDELMATLQRERPDVHEVIIDRGRLE